MKKILLLLLLLAAVPHTQAQNTYKDVDSTLYRYYRWCNNHIRDSVVLLKADTLFSLSARKQDVRMQAVALSLKADHYYFTGNLDSLKAWIPRVQAFARSHDQLKYVYFVWSRLILYYTKHTQYTLAQFELQHYLDQARRDDYKPATAEAYKQLGHIYRTRGLNRTAADYYRKAIDYIEENDLDRFSLPILYSEMAGMLTDIGQFDRAAEAIERGKACLTLPEYIWSLRIKEVILLSLTGQIARARRLYHEIEQGHKGYLDPIVLFETGLVLASQSGDYGQALRMLDSLTVRFSQSGNDNPYHAASLYLKRARIYGKTGDYKQAYGNLEKYTELFRSKVTDDNERTLGEFATLLDVERLDREKTELQRQAQEERLRRSQSILTALAVILLLALLFIVLLTRMNRRLARARRAAEESDRMKGIFIRTITHEINTPLNAIVGFAELASTLPADDAERQSYIAIIRENSGFLQKLVDDVLYISDLESSDGSPVLTPTDPEALCRESIRIATNDDPAAPEIRLQSPGEASRIRTSSLLLVKALAELLRNAVRFAPGGPVMLSYRIDPAARTISFSVSDTGPGVPASEAGRIFERFVKLDPFSQGMGLGLSVCRMIARTLGGQVRLDENYRDGARFVLTVPTGETN